jgi:redox-sensitive bicupin YhaK (pirin superfamily)
VQVISGRLAVNGVELSAGDGAKIAEESALHFMATDEAEILLFDLPPHQ